MIILINKLFKYISTLLDMLETNIIIFGTNQIAELANWYINNDNGECKEK